MKLRTFGTVDLEAAAAVDVGRALRQPKRVALLVYLAVHAPGGFIHVASFRMPFRLTVTPNVE